MDPVRLARRPLARHHHILADAFQAQPGSSPAAGGHVVFPPSILPPHCLGAILPDCCFRKQVPPGTDGHAYSFTSARLTYDKQTKLHPHLRIPIIAIQVRVISIIRVGAETFRSGSSNLKAVATKASFSWSGLPEIGVKRHEDRKLQPESLSLRGEHRGYGNRHKPSSIIASGFQSLVGEAHIIRGDGVMVFYRGSSV